ncbi:L-threonylcarbamoyladenylate synthase [Pedobacter alpinus]|uniref:Threonylcarbamoyl-AMP synthase n=1 Tax=Pedobacter alpinus TaxID=1590643 RepID=A0ABW5TUI7_9SPHI
MDLITKNLGFATQILKQNGVVAIPTETVYGLAANAFSEDAVKKIFEIKQRPFFNPLIVHISSKQYLEKVALNIPEKAYQLIDVFWPGALTLILDKQAHVPDIVTANKTTVAVRMPNHPLTLALLNQLDFPLAAPSANPFKRISSTTASHVYDYFKDDLKYILDGGECEQGLESTIIGFNGNDVVLYRHGAISVEQIETVVGKLKVITQQENAPVAPGMLLKHYSPKTKLILTNNLEKEIALAGNINFAVLAFHPQETDGLHQYLYLAQENNLEKAAANLYTTLHHLDTLNFDLIIAQKLPETGLGKTINDRLTRASAE